MNQMNSAPEHPVAPREASPSMQGQELPSGVRRLLESVMDVQQSCGLVDRAVIAQDSHRADLAATEGIQAAQAGRVVVTQLQKDAVDASDSAKYAAVALNRAQHRLAAKLDHAMQVVPTPTLEALLCELRRELGEVGRGSDESASPRPQKRGRGGKRR